MTKKKSTGNSRLFFIEFLIVLIFFLIISTVCLKLFVHAHKITEHADDLSHAQTMAASAAELLLAGYDKEETLAICKDQFGELFESYSENDFADDSKNALSNTEESAGYLMLILETGYASNLESASAASCINYLIRIYVNQSEEPIYELPLTVNAPLTKKEVMP